MDLTGTGVWNGSLRYGDPKAAAEAAAELEDLGYTAAWLPDIGGDVFGAVANVLGATSTFVVATGILNVWMHTPEEAAAGFNELVDAHGARFMMGIGISHQPFIDLKAPGTYQKPLATMRAYLDGLDAAPRPVPAPSRCIAALGPKMLELARDRTRGSHPYLANPQHTAVAREILGAGPLLAPEQPVVLETDADAARAIARTHLATYLTLPNYVNNLLRLDLTEDDVKDGGSDKLVDSIVAWGDEGTIAKRVQEHRDAGADHVCIQVLTGAMELPRNQWRRLAPALT